ncbi:NAD(P)-dependent alcohol dehydrogenase [Pseudonocardia spinosispora]|uniref:NAD(P)-dependent alcohol dehydrogenase n=1 Tax=Pseudonocardia spinosispora TaxID=103441 RepID=UPI0003F76EB2|nr:NAD(P)-dependent alcohol dehydrogenase [Pseudonocardia spinosispora]
MEITAAVAHKPHADFTLETLTLDGPKAGEVLVKIASVGLCHTDLAAREGIVPIAMPAVLGHEGAGTVVEVGEGVTKVKAGDKVALTFNSCGQCPNCQRGERAYCYQFLPLNYMGTRLDGSAPINSATGPVNSVFFGQSSFASHSLANEQNVVKLADDAPLDLVGPLGCGIQTGAGAVMNSMAAHEGSSLLVLGGGSVGLSGVMGGVVQGCETIIVLEPHQSRRELALELGATHALDPAAGDLAEQVRAIVPTGVQYVFDTTGIPAVIESSLGAMAPHASLGLVGVPTDPTAAINLNLIMAMTIGVKLYGIIEGDAVPDEFIPRLAELHKAGRFPFDKMITKYPFSQINEAIEAQHKGAAVKIVLVND